MKIKFYNPKEFEKTHKVTIQKTGKMGFTKDAAEYLKLERMKSANIGENEDDPTDKSLYLVVLEDTSGFFSVQKAGNYFYIKTSVLFDGLKLDYANNTISYDMNKIVEDGETYYKLILRADGIKENGMKGK